MLLLKKNLLRELTGFTLFLVLSSNVLGRLLCGLLLLELSIRAFPHQTLLPIPPPSSQLLALVLLHEMIDAPSTDLSFLWTKNSIPALKQLSCPVPPLVCWFSSHLHKVFKSLAVHSCFPSYSHHHTNDFSLCNFSKRRVVF